MMHHIRRYTTGCLPRSASIVLRGLFVLAMVLFLISTAGCSSMLPTDPASRRAETAWQLLHTMDTMQTIQIAKNPSCFREANGIAAALYGSDHPSSGRVAAVNIAGSLLHMRVSRWFDDHADEANANETDTRGLWNVGRITWHTVGILWSGSAVAGNYSLGLSPTGAKCD